MPNHITNVIRFEGEEGKIAGILRDIQNDDFGTGSIDFNKLIPMPDSVFQGPLGKQEREQYPGDLNWYDWSVKHWGTKWNAYDFIFVPEMPGAIVFHTAWASVPQILEVLSSKYPDVGMEYSWADEDIGSNTGSAVFRAGEVESVYIPEERSPEAYSFAGSVISLIDAPGSSAIPERPETREAPEIVKDREKER